MDISCWLPEIRWFLSGDAVCEWLVKHARSQSNGGVYRMEEDEEEEGAEAKRRGQRCPPGGEHLDLDLSMHCTAAALHAAQSSQPIKRKA